MPRRFIGDNPAVTHGEIGVAEHDGAAGGAGRFVLVERAPFNGDRGSVGSGRRTPHRAESAAVTGKARGRVRLEDRIGDRDGLCRAGGSGAYRAALPVGGVALKGAAVHRENRAGPRHVNGSPDFRRVAFKGARGNVESRRFGTEVDRAAGSCVIRISARHVVFEGRAADIEFFRVDRTGDNRRGIAVEHGVGDRRLTAVTEDRAAVHRRRIGGKLGIRYAKSAALRKDSTAVGLRTGNTVPGKRAVGNIECHRTDYRDSGTKRSGIGGELAPVNSNCLATDRQPTDNEDRSTSPSLLNILENQVVKRHIGGFGNAENTKIILSGFAVGIAVERDVIRLIRIIDPLDDQAVVVDHVTIGVNSGTEIETAVKLHRGERVFERDRGIRSVVGVTKRAVGVVGDRFARLVVNGERFAERNQAVPRIDRVAGGRHVHARGFRAVDRRGERFARRVEIVVPEEGAVTCEGVGHRHAVGIGRGNVIGENARRGNRDVGGIGGKDPRYGAESDRRDRIAVEILVRHRRAGHGDRDRLDRQGGVVGPDGIIGAAVHLRVNRVGAGVGVGRDRGQIPGLAVEREGDNVPALGAAENQRVRQGVVVAGHVQELEPGNRGGSNRGLAACHGNLVVVLIGAGERVTDRDGPRADVGIGEGTADRVEGDRIAFDLAAERAGNRSDNVRSVVGLILRNGGERDRLRRDRAGHLNRFGIAVDGGVADGNRIRADVAVGRLRGRPGRSAVGGILDRSRNDGAVEFDQRLAGAVIDLRQADDTVPEILERAAILRPADRAGLVVQVLRRVRRNRGVGSGHAGRVDGHRARRKGVLRFDVVAADKEDVPFLQPVTVGIDVDPAVITGDTLIAGIDVVEFALTERRFADDRVGNCRCAIGRIPVDIVPAAVGSAVPGNG